MKFKLFARNELLGETLLENGDPPMGVAFGELIPNEHYFKYQELFCTQDFQRISELKLTVISESGVTLEPSGGIGIEDYSKDMGELSIYVNVLGIDSSVYNQLFPAHVAAYEAQFR
ncbi:hypothetical protein [Microbulbifer celer]|uniref:Uncharacterized protein n=1 Tax=Microbulbifer celer TaxID=435905 RepID=A0ABW3UES4_9GAMM|nr:hypothetical protein [Microbulbifer celer]UFN56853.1 hypothetical protein LPW13_14950 [Microbulbifer celer]